VPVENAPLAVLGPTGYTGRLICERARELGLRLRLVGRRRDALEALAREGDEVRVADARGGTALRSAFEGAGVVASCAGPFLPIGTTPVAAAIAAGAHYVDTSGEQAFARRVYEECGPAAAERGVVLLTSFGFDYVPGDLAARLAAEGLDEPLDEIVVAYSVSGFASSSGTRRTIGHVMTQPLVAFADGALVRSRFGATTRRVRFPSGERGVVEWSGTEPLTVPRHTRVGAVRSYVQAPRLAAKGAALGALAAPFVRLSARLGGGPGQAQRAKSRFAVVAEARGSAGARRATLVGTDVYGLTALLVVRAAQGLLAGEARGVGALAPAEAFDATTFVAHLAPLLSIDSLEEI
jgi:short subunit dehydrogenase-like uncharacterized protein